MMATISSWWKGLISNKKKKNLHRQIVSSLLLKSFKGLFELVCHGGDGLLKFFWNENCRWCDHWHNFSINFRFDFELMTCAAITTKIIFIIYNFRWSKETSAKSKATNKIGATNITNIQQSFCTNRNRNQLSFHCCAHQTIIRLAWFPK